MSSGQQSTGSVVHRALSLLDAFLPGRDRLQLTEMARASGLPLSTAHRLAHDLLNWGALERTPDGLYIIGSRLKQVASMASRGRLLREVCLPVMEDLAATTGHTVLLAILEDGMLAFVENVSGTESDFRPRKRPGLILATAAGRLLVAFSNPALQHQLLGSPIADLTSQTMTNPDLLRMELAEIRLRGYAVAERQSCESVTGIAVPLWDSSGRPPVAALSLVMPVDALDLAVSIALCKSAAGAISRSLGRPSLP